MGNKSSSRLSLEIIPENNLNYEEMTKAPPSTMNKVKQAGGAYTTAELPWPQYILDNWYSSELAPFMVSSPRSKLQLTTEDIQLLQSNPTIEACQDLIARVEIQFPGDNFSCFVRLSMCSTKRGSHACPAMNAMEVVQQILDSQRCVQSLSCPCQHTIWFFQWNEACDITREFRVFIKKNQIVALAPYYCAVPLPWLTAANAENIGERILDFYTNVLQNYITSYFEDAVMDVLVTEDNEIKLIEFNPMVTSGGGLFSWIDDADLLNGSQNKKKNPKVVMRIVKPFENVPRKDVNLIKEIKETDITKAITSTVKEDDPDNTDDAPSTKTELSKNTKDLPNKSDSDQSIHSDNDSNDSDNSIDSYTYDLSSDDEEKETKETKEIKAMTSTETNVTPMKLNTKQITLDIEQVQSLYKNKTDPFILSISLEHPSAYVKFNPELPILPTSYHVVPFDNECTTMHVKLTVSHSTSEKSMYQNSSPFDITVQYNNINDYPKSVPRITFTSQIVHHSIDQHTNSISNESMQHFTTQLNKDYSIMNVIQQLKFFFEVPLHPCEHCNHQFQQMAIAHQQHYVQFANAYRSIREHGAQQRSLQTAVSDPFWKFQHELYQSNWLDEWFDPLLIAALKTNTKESILSILTETDAKDVYTFPCFTSTTCDYLLQELDHYTQSGLPSPRPNSMNKYGLILNSIGLEKTFSKLQQTVLNQISQVIFREEGTSLDWHHTFLVQYKPGEDLGLDMHTDDSDVTFNICLGREFTGARLEFCGKFGTTEHRQHKSSYSHQKGTAVVHLGRQRHGAMNIESGERVNLIIWNKSLPYRSLQKSNALVSLYPKEDGPPDEICLSMTHDRDWDLYGDKGKTRDVDQQQHKPWCPPAGKEHDGSPLL